jgi:hypothetical protein
MEVKMRNRLTDFARVALSGVQAFINTAVNAPGTAAAGSIDPIRKRVLLIIYNPKVPGEGGRKLNQVLRWNDPDDLTRRYIEDAREISYGYANYEIVERLEVDDFPVKADGFKYTADDFVNRWRTRSGFHQPDAVSYDAILSQFQIIDRVNREEIDEVWLHAFPHAGFYESIMGGPGAFWCNAPALKQTSHAKRRFVVMGFNYERGVGEMLEAFGHRAESILKHAFRQKRGDANLWQRFARYDKTHPGKAEVGIVHFAPNSLADYDWGNKTVVPSRCDDWLNYPNFSDKMRQVNCADWGNGDIRLHHVWWFRHFPHIAGTLNGMSNNWWEYVIDPNLVR